MTIMTANLAWMRFVGLSTTMIPTPANTRVLNYKNNDIDFSLYLLHLFCSIKAYSSDAESSPKDLVNYTCIYTDFVS